VPGEAEVRAALDQVLDPCSEVAGVPAGLSEMGLVRSLEIEESPAGTVVRVAIGVTEPTCLMGPSLAHGARDRLGALPGVARVEVTLSTDDWTPADMTDDYRDRLTAHRAARRRALGIADVVETPMGAAIQRRTKHGAASVPPRGIGHGGAERARPSEGET
jgi:metal-sulfur cluster biosynthetic enzyme